MAPLKLFEILVTQCRVERGALLLPERDTKSLRVWASVGLDPTSSGRLRLDRDTATRLLSGPLPTRLLEKEQLNPWNEFLSQRDYDRTERLGATAIRLQDSILGAILILDSPLLRLPSQIYKLAFSALEDPLAKGIIGKRERALQALIHPAVLDPGEATRVLTPRERELSLNVQLRAAIESLAEGFPHADRYLLAQELGFVVTSLLAGSNVISSDGGDRYTAYFSRPQDGEVIEHQLRSSIRTLVPDFPADASLISHANVTERSA